MKDFSKSSRAQIFHDLIFPHCPDYLLFMEVVPRSSQYQRRPRMRILYFSDPKPNLDLYPAASDTT